MAHYSYSLLLQTLLVAFLLFGTPKPVGCRSAGKDGLSKDGEAAMQVIAKRWREGSDIMRTRSAAASSDDWRVCGELRLSSQFRIIAANRSQSILHYVLQRGGRGMEVSLSPDTGIVKCKCHQPVSLPTVDTTAHQAAFEVLIADSKNNHFTIDLPLEAPCQLSFCQRKPTTLLRIDQRESGHLFLDLNPECSSTLVEHYGDSKKLLQIFDDGVVALSLPAAIRDSGSSPRVAYGMDGALGYGSSLSPNQHRDQSSQLCTIDVIRSISVSNGTRDADVPDSLEIKFIQSLPLDLTSCTNWRELLRGRQSRQAANGRSTIYLSVKPWLSNPYSLFTHPQSSGDMFTSRHAKPSTTTQLNAIHDKGGSMVRESSTRHGNDRLRKIRQTSTSPPQFNDTFYMASVLENSPFHTVVTGVRATGNAPITYTMTPDSRFSEGLFSMNSSTGVVTTADLIDREMISSHSFRIQAVDASGRSSIAQMTITVDDENDNVPTFERSYFNITVDEDTDRTSTILRFAVEDDDLGQNGMVDFLLVNNTDNTFTVADSGSQVAIVLNRQLDYESNRFYLLTISARDRGTPTRSSSATLEIHVIDVADSIPQFNATSYSTEVAEDISPPAYLLTVHATSEDSAPLDGIQYIKVSGDSNNQFSVNGNTGVITLTKSLDFETTQVHAIVIQAQSVENSILHSQTNVHITVSNVNDHHPVFTRQLYSISVLETVNSGHLVITVDAPDLDEGEFGNVFYQFSVFSEQVIYDTFALDSTSGQITTSTTLDREQRDQYMFTVVARDSGTPPLSSTSRVSVTVSDVNDEPPIFSQREYSAAISENLDAGRSVTQVFAEDSDSSTSVVNYYIQSGNINNAFGIETQDGLITTRTRLDREQYASYNLIVVASDGINENTTHVLISVLDINDESPTFELSLYNLPAISEGLSVGSEVGSVHAVDPDEGSNGQVTYTSTNIDQKFIIDQTTGAILLSSSLDYEDTERYVFDVIATDGGQPPLSSTARVQISVLDANDNSPVFDPHPVVLSILENQPAGQIITTVMATDADSGSNSAVQYEIVGDSQAKKAFGIRQNGEVYTQESLDREVIGQYQLIIQAADGGTVRRSTTMTVTVNVDDIIDYPPVFSQVVYEVLITSPHFRGLPVVTVRARTLDLVQPQSIIYYITSGANSTLFRMDQATGMIFAETTIDPLIHEGVYRMGVVAQHRHLSESVFVIIRVMLDDGIPRLRPLTLYFSAYPSLMEQRNHLGVVEIVQPKDGQEYTFSIGYSDSRVQKHFFINPTTGYLSVARGVVSGHYSLNVSASTSTGVGFVLVDLFVTILTNQTFENAVVATFGGAREASFASIQLDQFIQFLIEVVPCSRSQVEIVGIQRSGAEREEMVSVAFSILQSDHTSYIPREKLVDVLQANRHNVQPSTLLSFTSDVCSEEPCSNLQRCLPIIEIHRHSAATPFKVISSTHHFHIFKESFVCSCPEGYSRDNLCSSEIDECDPSPCYFGARCTDLVGDYQCHCPSGTYDKNCSSVCASRESCDPCDPNPCLHGGNCNRHPQDLTSYSCEACPWRNEYGGTNCELTTLHFQSESSSFVAFQPIYGTSRFDLNLRFTTISPNGLLFYIGHLENQDDYIAAELVIGQLRVGVSLGGVATTLTTDSVWNLNDGLWHSVSIKLSNRVLMAEVSDCSRQPEFLEQASESCQLETELHPEGGRTLELNTLLYFGGIEPHIPHENILSSAFDGCIADVKLGGQLLDFNQPEREDGTEIGCPPREGSCSQICPRNEECVQLWGGSVCNCETDSCVGGSSVQLSNGYIHLESLSTITLMSFILYFRTRSSDAVLVQLGSFDSLELKHGSIIYRRGYSSSNMHTPLTLEVLGAVSDGVWHKVRLDVNNTHTKLSVDDGRSSASIPEGGIMRITTVILGAEVAVSNSSRFSGCLAGMVINVESINLVDALANTILNQHFQVSTHMTGSGCGAGSPCNGVQCPDSSQCEEGWQNYSCVCSLPNRVIDNQCVNPCSTEPCKNGGTCEVVPFGSGGFQCTCAEGYPLPTCEVVNAGGCGVGFYDPPTCSEHCLCDPKGTEPQICDSSTGRCTCKAGLDVYSVSGDVGCQPCDCHAVGSVVSKCNEDTGQCLCRENVMGRRCDQCTEDFAGMDELGCKAATVVYGRFSFMDLFYERELGVSNSPTFKEMSQRIATEIERELYSFTLPGRFEVDIERFFNSSGLVTVGYKISSYLPRGSLSVLRPSYSMLAGVVQSMVQSGWVGPLQTNSSSHIVPIVCSQVPELCSGCPNATTRDGIICRAAATCPGVDSDRDGIPDSCDNCPYNFNPDQNKTYCAIVGGVCPGDVAMEIVWSRTSVGMVDIKQCPPPLLGFARRTCMAGQEWSDVDLFGCISVAGQEFLAQAESMDNGQTLTFSRLRETAAQLEEFTNEQEQTTELIGGDVQVAGRVLDRLLRQLRGYAGSEAAGQDGILMLFEKLISISDKLLSPTPSQGWVGVVEEAGFGSEDFLATLEQLPVVTLNNMWENASSPREHLVIKTRQSSSADGNELYFANTLLLSELSASLELPLTTSTSSVAMAMFSNLGPALNSYLFISNATDPLSVATPILSIQMFNEATKVTALTTPINLTLPYKNRLFLPHLRSRVRCAWWQTGERSGWSTEGCETVSAASRSHVTCRCTHLTAFAAILPARAFTVVQTFPGKFSPSPFTYVIFSLIFILLLVTLLFLLCLRHMQTLLNTTHKNLVLALLLTTLVFAVGIDRTEVGALCSFFGIVMFYLFLVCMSWMVANGVIIARFLIDTPPKETFAITLYIIGWALPALISGIAIGSVSIINPSGGFLSKFGYPYYCWISEYSFGGLVASALLLIVLYIIAVIISIVLRIRLKRVKERGRNVSIAAAAIRNNTSVVLLKSFSIFILFLVTWSLGLVAVYLRDESYGDYLQYAFTTFYGIFGVIVVVVLCANKHFVESLKLQFRKQPDVIIGDTTGPVYAEIRKPPTSHRRTSQQRQQQQHRHHQHGGRRNRKQTPLIPPVGERVELMTIAPVPTHPPPSPMAINNQGNSIAPYSQSSPLLRNNAVGEGHQNQNRSTSERHIAENQVKPSILHVPEMRPFSPLTYGSDTGSHVSNVDDIDHVPSILRRMQEETDGATATGVPPTLSSREKEDLSEAPRQSPTLTEIYEQARRSSNRTSARSYDAEQRPGSGQTSEMGDVRPNSMPAGEGNGLTGVSEDPLWYKTKEPVAGESDPMPYETAVRSPPLVTAGSVPVSPGGAGDSERRGLPSFSPMTSRSPLHSDGSVTSSSKQSSASRSSSHNRSPTSISPANISYLRHEHERKHSLPVEWAKRQGSSSTTNPLYSTSAAVPTKKHPRRKHHRSFNSQIDDQPLPPILPVGPIHTSPLPPLPYPLESPGAGAEALRHTHFVTPVPAQYHHHHQLSETSDRELPPRTAAMPYTLPPLSHVKDASSPPKVKDVPHQLPPDRDAPPLPHIKDSPQLPHDKDTLQPAKNMSPPLSQVTSPVGTTETSPSSLQTPVEEEERKSISCSSSPAQKREKKKRGLERNDSYHSDGPSAEGKQVFRHSDGSKTVQSLV